MAKTNYLPSLDFQPFIAPQQALPVEEFDALGQTLNKRYDENIAKWDELDAYMNQVQLSEADKSIKDSVIADTRGIIKQIREKGNWENSKLPIREVAKRLANDQSLSIAQQNFKKQQEVMEEERKAGYNPSNSINFALNRFNESTIDPTTGRARVLNYSGLEKLADYDARRKSLFEGLQADGYDNSNSSPKMDASTGMVYQIGSGSSARYVSAKKIKEVATRNLDNYLQSAEGQQELRKHTTVNSMNGQPLDIASAKKQILNDLINTGMTRQFNITGQQSSTSITSMGSGASSKDASTDMLEGSQIERNQNNPILSTLADKLDDKKSRDASTIMGGDIALQGGSRVGRVPLDKKEQEAVDKIALGLGIKKGNNGYSNSDLNKIKDFASEKSNTGISYTMRTFTDTEIPKVKNYAANGNYRGRKIYSITDKKFYDYDKLPQNVRKKLESGSTEGIQFQGVIDPDNPFGDMAKGKYKDTKGWVSPEAITVDGNQLVFSSSLSDVNKEDIEFRNLIQKVSKPGRTGVPIYLGKGSNKELIVPTGNGMYQLKDNKGNLLHPKQYTKEQIALYAKTYNLEPEEEE